MSPILCLAAMHVSITDLSSDGGKRLPSTGQARSAHDAPSPSSKKPTNKLAVLQQQSLSVEGQKFITCALFHASGPDDTAERLAAPSEATSRLYLAGKCNRKQRNMTLSLPATAHASSPPASCRGAPGLRLDPQHTALTQSAYSR